MEAAIQVRLAVPDDSNDIFSMIQLLAHYERAPEQVINTPQKIREHGFGDAPLFKCWVAEMYDSNGQTQIVGIAVCYIRYSTWKGPVLYLEDIVVKDEFRRAGIGSKLFTACLQYAQTMNYPRITWQVLDWNEPAIKFYEKYGATFDGEWINCSIDFPDKSLE